MYTRKCSFCPEWYSNASTHVCKDTFSAVVDLRVGICECGASKNPGDETCGKDYGPCYDWQQVACEGVTAALATAESETAAKPTRYNRGSLEVWDAIEQLQFDYKQGNVLKYISRYKDKKGPEDLLKAINYIIKMISQETGADYYELHKLTPEELAKRIKK